MKLRIITSVTLNETELALLQEATRGYLEYREGNTTWEEYKTGRTELTYQTPEWFAKRNHNGTYRVALRLEEIGLLEDCGDPWNPTFILTKLGKSVVSRIGSVDLDIINGSIV